MADGITVGQVLFKLIGAAANRIGAPIAQKISRVKQIESVLTGAIQKDSAATTALHDFEVVIGSVYGELTEELHAFFRELERSGLLTAVGEAAILNVQSASAKEAFLRLHDGFVHSAIGNGSELYERLYLAIGTSLRAMSKDPANAFLSRAAAKDLRNRVDVVSSQLSSLLKQPEPVASFMEAAPLLEDYLRSVVTSLRHLRVETHRGPRPIDISKIYVPSRVRPRNSAAAVRYAELRANARHSPSTNGALFAERRHWSLSLEDLKITFRRTIILGDPGGGKSTLLQAICHDFAKKSLLQIQYPERKELDAKVERVPLRIVLRSYETAKRAAPQLGLFDYICNEVRLATGADHDLIQRSVRYLLYYGRAVLAFDGLDEILDVGRRRDFVQTVLNFCEQHPLCPAIVTSRIVGYEEAPLSDDYIPMVLNRFENTEVAQYVEKFLKAFENQTTEQAKAGAADFLRQTENNAADLRQNPLMLGLMALLFATNKGDIPSNRPEIYRECSTLLFEKWDQNRSIRAQIPQFDFLDLFRTFAFKIFGNAELEEGVSREWIQQQNTEYFSEYFESKAKAYEAAKSVADFITGRSWLMDAFGPNVFRFTHRTFLEYYFAQDLDQKHELLSELLAVLRPKILNREWDVICHLAIQIKANRNMSRIGQAIAFLAKQIVNTKGRKQRAAVVEFSAKALEYLPGIEQDVRALVTNIIDAAFALSVDPKYSAIEVINQLCNAGVDRREFIRSILVEQLQSKLKSDGHERRAAVWMLSDSHDRMFWGESALQHRDITLPAEVRGKVIEAGRSNNRDRADKSVQDAFLYWVWYRDQFENLFSRYGFTLFFERTPDTSRVIGVIDCWRIAASSVIKNEQRLLPKDIALDALKVIGRTPLPPVAPFRIGNSAYVRIPSDIFLEPLRQASLPEPLILRGLHICLILLAEAGMIIDVRRNGSAPSKKNIFAHAVEAIRTSIDQSKAKHPTESQAVDFESILGWLDGNWSLIEGRGIKALRRSGAD